MSSRSSSAAQPRAGMQADACAAGGAAAGEDDSASPASPPPTPAPSDTGWSSDGSSALAWLPLSDASGSDSDSDGDALRAAVVVHGAGDAPPMPALRDFAVAPQARRAAAPHLWRGGA